MTKKVTQNVTNSNSEDLTDKWKKGELPSGYYYVKNEFGNIFPSDYSEDYDCISDTVVKDFFTEVSEIKEVLEPVPSYKQWQAKLEENAQIKKQLAIAVEVLKDTYAICFRNKDTLLHTPEHNIIGGIERDCAIALKQIKELKND